jgi:hypothetical protein
MGCEPRLYFGEVGGALLHDWLRADYSLSLYHPLGVL